jgi:HK97 family phage prohead protease
MGLKVRGYAAVFGNIDSWGDIIDKGAFTAWLKENPNKEIPLFWEHDHVWSWDDPARPIGKTTTLIEDNYGLYYEAILSDTPKADELATLIQDGAIKGASFAYRVTDYYVEDEIRHLSGLALMEVSPVNWGANDKAYIEVHPQQENTDDA